MKKILLDTDIGSDIDDAVCLAYLLANPECELVGVTTVSGESVKRAQLASAICKVANRDIPIYPSIEKPLLVEQKQPDASQAVALNNWKHQKDFPQNQAIEFMRKTIRKNPGEITLLGIGPLTNIAVLFSIDPKIPSLLKELVLMCGVFHNEFAFQPQTEWNAICDPHATAIVYNAPVKIHKSIGLDVTLKVKMNADEVQKRFKEIPILHPVLDFANVWFKKQDKITFHDPLAAATIFNNDICRFNNGDINVNLEDQHKLGTTQWTEKSNGKHMTATTVDSDIFFKHYFSVF